MLLLVTGSRTLDDRWVVYRKLDSLAPGGLVVGDAIGVDLAARFWAGSHLEQENIHIFQADWKTFGRRAGPIRNQAMVDFGPDYAVAFWDGHSPGTADCIHRCKTAGIAVEIVML